MAWMQEGAWMNAEYTGDELLQQSKFTPILTADNISSFFPVENFQEDYNCI